MARNVPRVKVDPPKMNEYLGLRKSTSGMKLHSARSTKLDSSVSGGNLKLSSIHPRHILNIG